MLTSQRKLSLNQYSSLRSHSISSSNIQKSNISLYGLKNNYKLRKSKTIFIRKNNFNNSKYNCFYNRALNDSLKGKNNIFSMNHLNNIYIEPTGSKNLIFHLRKSKEIFRFENPIKSNKIFFNLENLNNLYTKKWYVLNYPNNYNLSEPYIICLNDIIKMGNVELIVKEIHLKDEANISNIIKNDNSSLNDKKESIYNFCPKIEKYFLLTEKAESEGIKCKFCRKYECDIDNPVICFCFCNEYFHFKCLREKIKKKTRIIYRKNNTIKNYYIINHYCKKCKLNYPLKFKIDENEIIYKILTIDNPKESSYMILESINNNHYFPIKFIFVIELNNNKIRIGRNKYKNDIIIIDPSISLNHAEIEYKNGKIFLINKSKTFGTLISIQKPIKINFNIIEFQLGKTVIEAKHIKLGEFQIL